VLYTGSRYLRNRTAAARNKAVSRNPTQRFGFVMKLTGVICVIG
jgi:hypothetical protein